MDILNPLLDLFIINNLLFELLQITKDNVENIINWEVLVEAEALRRD